MELSAGISIAARVLVVTVFAYSAVTKVRNREAWTSYRAWLTGLPLGRLVRPGVPQLLVAVESALVILVLIPPVATLGLILAAGTSLVLTVGVLAAIRGGSAEPCHCLGASARPLGRAQAGRNVALVALTAIGAVFSARLAPGALRPGVLGAAVVAGLILALLLIFLDDIIWLFPTSAEAGSLTGKEAH